MDARIYSERLHDDANCVTTHDQQGWEPTFFVLRIKRMPARIAWRKFAARTLNIRHMSFEKYASSHSRPWWPSGRIILKLPTQHFVQ